jgi:hypothetical protein
MASVGAFAAAALTAPGQSAAPIQRTAPSRSTTPDRRGIFLIAVLPDMDQDCAE